MTYIYEVSFELKPSQLDQIQMGSAVERVLSYLKVLLPNEPGFVNARAMYSLNIPKHTEIIFSSIWEDWDDLVKHRESKLAEEKILTEFEPCVDLEDLKVQIFDELP